MLHLPSHNGYFFQCARWVTQSFNPEFSYSVPSLTLIEQERQQVELVKDQAKTLNWEILELTNELNVARQQVRELQPNRSRSITQAQPDLGIG